MPGDPLYPHKPKSRQPLFPHVPGGRAVTVVCPICGKEIEVPDYNAVTRSDALREHLKREHPKHPLLAQVTIEGGEPVSPQYRHLVSLVSEPLPKDAY